MRFFIISCLLVLSTGLCIAQTGGVWHLLPDPLSDTSQKKEPPKPKKDSIAPATVSHHSKVDTLAKDTTKNDTGFVQGKVMFQLFIDVSCDSLSYNCDSLQAIRDPCFIEYLQDKHNQEDCQTGAKDCNIEFKILPIVVDQSLIHPRKAAEDRLWLFILLTFQLLLVVYLRVGFARSIEDTVKAYFNINLSQQLYREQEPSQPFSAFVLNLNFIISITIFVYLLIREFLHPATSPLPLIGGTLLFVTAIYVGKYLLMRIVGILFPFGDEMNFYSFNFFINQKLLGVVLIPSNFIVAYSPSELTRPVIYISLALLAIAYLLRSFRGLVIARNYIYAYKFHFLVYICTLEIAPLLIIFKLIVKGLH
jgi:hypothetical protein